MSKIKVLIVDPDERSAQFLKEDLADDGHESQMVTNGPDALAMAESGSFNLAIIDRNLADIDSLRLCQKIRAQQSPERLSIIVISSFDDNEDRKKARTYGVDEYLCKPFLYSTLANLINDYH